MTNHSSSRQPKEPFTKIERRDWAETVLDNPELLMMYAQSSGAVSPRNLKFEFPSSTAPPYHPTTHPLLVIRSGANPLLTPRLRWLPLQTLPATRFRFKKIMCGLEEDDEEEDDDDDDSIPDSRGPGGGYQQQKYQGQSQQSQSLRSSSAQQQQHQQHQQQRGRGDGGSRSGRR